MKSLCRWIGPKCSLCYLIFSAFSVIVLIGVGLLFYPAQYPGLGGEHDLSNTNNAILYAKNCFFTAAFFAVCFCLCTFRFVCLHFQRKRNNPYNI